MGRSNSGRSGRTGRNGGLIWKEITKKSQRQICLLHTPRRIRDICLKEDVDIGVGLDMYITNHHLTRSKELMEQSKEFRDLCRENPLKNIVEALGK